MASNELVMGWESGGQPKGTGFVVSRAVVSYLEMKEIGSRENGNEDSPLCRVGRVAWYAVDGNSGCFGVRLLADKYED